MVVLSTYTKKADLSLKSSSFAFLSYPLCESAPSYGAKHKFRAYKESDISKGDIANSFKFETSVHMGTHIDFPKHFFDDGKSALDFGASFFVFEKPLFVRLEPKSKIVKEELIEVLSDILDEGYDILLADTASWRFRDKEEYWSQNYGFDPSLAGFIRDRFNGVRVFGFDSISVSSYTNRELGRAAHRSFLDPAHPILLLEDMDFSAASGKNLKSVTVSPLRVDGADGALCTVIGEFCD